MKYLFVFALVLTVSFSAQAQTPVPKETANAYFQNCVKTASPTQDMSVQGQQMLCACTAARLTQFFSMEDWQAMTAADPAIARPAYNKMMVEVYAPCMGEPTRERYAARCTKSAGANMQVCQCAAGKLSVYMQNHGARLFSDIIAQNASVEDPWAAIENYPEFNDYIETATRECLK